MLLTIKDIADILKIRRQSADKKMRGIPYTTEQRKGSPTKLYALPDCPADVQVKAAIAKARKTATRMAQIGTTPEFQATQQAALLAQAAEYVESITGKKSTRGRKPKFEPQAFTQEQYEAMGDIYGRKPESTRKQAVAKLAAVQAFYRLRNGDGVTESSAAKTVAHEMGGASWLTVWNWSKEVKGHPKAYWLYVLCPRTVGCVATADCSPEAWDTILVDYLRRERPTFASCFDRLKRSAAAHGWTIPSEDTFWRRLKREVTPQEITLARDGEDALNRTRPSIERDHAVFHALEAVNADGFDSKIYVIFEDGSVGKFCMVAYQDIYSAKILSYRIGKFETTDLYQLAFGDLVERYGIPEHVWLDNTRAAANKTMTGGIPNRYRFKVLAEEIMGYFPRVSTEVHWTQPGHGQSKTIERAWRDMRDGVEKHPALAGAYSKAGAIPIAKVREIIASEIAAHNARTGRRSPVCAGRSFDEVFDESYQANAEKIRRGTAEQRRLWLLAAVAVHAAKDSGMVTLFSNRYWCEALGRHAGQSLTVRYDPERLHGSVFVERMDGTFVCEAPCVAKAGFNDREQGREATRLQAKYRKNTKERLALTRRIDVQEVAKRTPPQPAAPAPASAVVRGTFGDKTRKAVAAQAAAPAPQGVTPEMQDNFERALEQMRAQSERLP